MNIMMYIVLCDVVHCAGFENCFAVEMLKIAGSICNCCLPWKNLETGMCEIGCACEPNFVDAGVCTAH
jgi:hypothetical protein